MTTTTLLSRAGVCALALCLSPALALAMPQTGTATTADLSPTPTAAAGGFDGNDIGEMGTGLTNLNDLDVFTSDTWQYAGQSDEPNTPYSNNPDGQTNGTLTFTVPQDGPFVVSIKASNFYALYYYDASHIGVTDITFTTSGASINPNNGNSPGFSHGTFYTVVPTPGALALLGGAGLIGVRRRR